MSTDERAAQGFTLLKTQESHPVFQAPSALVRNRTMTDYDIPTQKRIVREKTDIHDPFYLGRDGDGNTHWWSPYHRRLAVVEGAEIAATGHIDAQPADDLRDYADAVARQAGGWADGPKLVSEHSQIERSIAAATRP